MFRKAILFVFLYVGLMIVARVNCKSIAPNTDDLNGNSASGPFDNASGDLLSQMPGDISPEYLQSILNKLPLNDSRFLESLGDNKMVRSLLDPQNKNGNDAGQLFKNEDIAEMKKETWIQSLRPLLMPFTILVFMVGAIVLLAVDASFNYCKLRRQRKQLQHL